jgi:hypothetical protein
MLFTTALVSLLPFCQLLVSAATVPHEGDILPSDSAYLQLNDAGDAYVDSSSQALAIRARHHAAMNEIAFAKLQAQGSGNHTKRQDSCNFYHNFQNWQTHGGYEISGFGEPGDSGFRFHSSKSTWRTTVKYNAAQMHGKPYTYLRVWFRGAPDAGKL